LPAEGWQIAEPDDDADIEAMRQDIRDLTLPSPVGSVQSSSLPPYDATPESLIPGAGHGRDIDLSPSSK
jgi:hypothetical protein